jgi:hypothetical protein
MYSLFAPLQQKSGPPSRETLKGKLKPYLQTGE